MATATGATPGHGPATTLAVLAVVAVAVPTLIAFNVSPSATFINQAASYVGWGAFLLALATRVPSDASPHGRGAFALLAAIALVLLAAPAASLWASVPWSLSLSTVGALLATLLVAAVGASAQRAGAGDVAFRAFCVGLFAAGVAGACVGLVQVFLPQLPDGRWIAPASIAGRATGNLRQPNHLSSLLLWSVVAAVWLRERGLLDRRAATVAVLVFIYTIVLTGSRTGALGMLTLAGWGLLDRRLAPRTRVLLGLAPLLYAGMWGVMSWWAGQGHQAFGAQHRFTPGENFSSSRIDIWSNTLSLIATHPWFGVGFNDFNFAWTLTAFPGRPTEFFDHSHNLVLNFAVEMGIPLAAVVLALFVYALWQALRNAVAEGREPAAAVVPVRRAAVVLVVLVAVHSMLEYPLWYAYFLLPTAFAFGLCVEPTAAAGSGRTRDRPEITRPYVIAAMVLMLGGTLAVYDYVRVVVIFEPPADAGPLERRVLDGRKSVLFGHHADYAAATITDHPGRVMFAFRRAPHYLLDSRLMIAWAKAFEERGEHEKARWVADRLREFRNDQAEEFFAPCRLHALEAAAAALGRGTTFQEASSPHPPAAATSAPSALPFQCERAAGTLRFEDFR